jgi:hypothetical protein
MLLQQWQGLRQVAVESAPLEDTQSTLVDEKVRWQPAQFETR